MSVDEVLMDAEERMEKAVARLKNDLTGIRTGRANPGMVDSLKAEVYGSPTPIKQIASVSAPEPQQLVIRPFDPGTIKDIEKGIIASDLGLAPQSDGKVIRLNIPALSGDVRKKMVARTKELSEESKVSIRNVRRDANKALDQLEKDKELSEDECKTYKDDIQELTNKFEGQASELAKTKEAEVLDE
ncbi:Ribosome-recycling factor [Posidoniimonas corsicana]|uniref:Ribosome-recycling factor n=1 Tax=Posidoniimonas corsicana TaxID=1938618 RepID=A0A5C5VI32_9BACT|nr:ribosome recycling factor [Posidoniimonas corsicana]TWT38256.1 Ribosome-recycling factor [Posidoniimonas corsicana]